MCIRDSINTLRILFFTCDMIKDNSELVDIIKIYLQSFNISKNERTYIFIDEITMVNNWQSAIKYLVDIGLIVNAVVILTGSSAYDLKVSSERTPGRRGEGKDLLFLPLTFNEYLKACLLYTSHNQNLYHNHGLFHILLRICLNLYLS